MFILVIDFFICSNQITVHLFTSCTYIKQVISNLVLHYGSPYFSKGNFRDCVLSTTIKYIPRLQIATYFVIWSERCVTIFRDESKKPQYMAIEITSEFNTCMISTEQKPLIKENHFPLVFPFFSISLPLLPIVPFKLFHFFPFSTFLNYVKNWYL